MIYRNYGNTGEKISLLGFGGMRFGNIADQEQCAAMMVKAAQGGVNYFDTAPGYFDSQSEAVFGLGLKELRRRNLPYFVSTKTMQSKEDDIRRELDASLKRLDVDVIDFYHIWCVTRLDDWEARKKNGVIKVFQKLKDEKLIRHICVSSHLIQNENAALFQDKILDGVLFGYSAYNFRTREKIFESIDKHRLGAAIMNPLGGGLIPHHPEVCGFLFEERGPQNSLNHIGAALWFLWDHKNISTTLVGFKTESDVDFALRAIEAYTPRTEEELSAVKSRSHKSFEGLCTGCGYCDECPEGIPIPKYMDAYNRKVLSGGKDGDRFIRNQIKGYWGLTLEGAAKCLECGNCEKSCTQHLDIIERLKYIAGLSEAGQ